MRYASSSVVLAIFAASVPAIVATAPAAAAVQPFNQAAFDAAQKAGKPILV